MRSIITYVLFGVVVSFAICAILGILGYVEVDPKVPIALISAVAAPSVGYIVWSGKQPEPKAEQKRLSHRSSKRNLTGLEQYVFDTLIRIANDKGDGVKAQELANYIESHPLHSVTIICVLQTLYRDGVI